MDVELWAPLVVTYNHWHGQVGMNASFDGDMEYLLNDEVVKSRQGFITLLWACTPHQLMDAGHCKQMAILNLPIHPFLSWPLGRELVNHVTHGTVITSLTSQQLGVFEIQRWQSELSSDSEQVRQLTIDEIVLMLKRFDLVGWQPVLGNRTSRTQKNSISRCSQFYVSQTLGSITANCDKQLTADVIAKHIKLSPNYAMGIFHRVVQPTMKQHITATRINYVRALPSDTDKTILDIVTIAGFCSSS